ncbi:unnamed protein product [Ascophyllum nodosum]
MANQPPDVDFGIQNIIDINDHPKSDTPHAGEGNAGSGNIRDGRGIEEGNRFGNAGRNQTFPQVSARVENVFCLGSPIGMFLMIRGQHRGLGKGFKLPGCRRLFNIFHPYDPVAFRLEPLLRANDGVPRGDQGGKGQKSGRENGCAIGRRARNFAYVDRRTESAVPGSALVARSLEPGVGGEKPGGVDHRAITGGDRAHRRATLWRWRRQS